MLRIAGPDDTGHHTQADLCRILHPSFGLPGRLVLSLVGDHGGATGGPATGGPAGDGSDGDGDLAEITRIDAVPRFLAGRPARRRARRR